MVDGLKVALVPDIPDLGYKPTIGEALRRAAVRFPEKDFVVMPHARLGRRSGRRDR
jgi:hypothetical protein